VHATIGCYHLYPHAYTGWYAPVDRRRLTQVDLYSGGKMVDDGDDDRYEPNAPSRW